MDNQLCRCELRTTDPVAKDIMNLYDSIIENKALPWLDGVIDLNKNSGKILAITVLSVGIIYLVYGLCKKGGY